MKVFDTQGRQQFVGAQGPAGPTGPGYAATSTTSLLIGTGSKVFTTQAGLAYSAGARVRASSAANGANLMEGPVASYAGTTLTVTVDRIGGAGTFADWNINLAGEVGATGAQGATGATGPTLVPGGRLTLTSGTPVLAAAVTAATTVFYTPYVNDLIPIFDGVNWQTFQPGELSLALDATNAPISKNFDVFAFNDAGTRRIGYGPAWSTDTARGVGAGTTELVRQNGLWVNANAITLRYSSVATVAVAVKQATYLGSFRTTAAGQTRMDIGDASAAGGTNSVLGLYNAYHRVRVACLNTDTGATYTYALTTWRPMANSVNNRVSWLDGLATSVMDMRGQQTAEISGSANPSFGFSLDTTTGIPAIFMQPLFTAAASAPNLRFSLVYLRTFSPQLGFHFAQAMEADGNTNVYTANFGVVGIMAVIEL